MRQHQVFQLLLHATLPGKHQKKIENDVRTELQILTEYMLNKKNIGRVNSLLYCI